MNRTLKKVFITILSFLFCLLSVFTLCACDGCGGCDDGYIELNCEKVKLDRFDTFHLIATPINFDDEILFKSSDETLAVVSNEGTVNTFGTNGVVKITAYSGEIYKDCIVTIESSNVLPAISTTISENLTTYIGETFSINATITYKDKVLTVAEILYTSDDANIATVNDEGVITAIGVGSTNIYIKYSWNDILVCKAISVTVIENESIFIYSEKSIIDLEVDGYEFLQIYLYNDGDILEITDETSIASNDYVSIVGNKLTAIKVGSGLVNVNYTFDDVEYACTIQVNVKHVAKDIKFAINKDYRSYDAYVPSVVVEFNSEDVKSTDIEKIVLLDNEVDFFADERSNSIKIAFSELKASSNLEFIAYTDKIKFDFNMTLSEEDLLIPNNMFYDFAGEKQYASGSEGSTNGGYLNYYGTYEGEENVYRMRGSDFSSDHWQNIIVFNQANKEEWTSEYNYISFKLYIPDTGANKTLTFRAFSEEYIVYQSPHSDFYSIRGNNIDLTTDGMNINDLKGKWLEIGLDLSKTKECTRESFKNHFSFGVGRNNSDLDIYPEYYITDFEFISLDNNAVDKTNEIFLSVDKWTDALVGRDGNVIFSGMNVLGNDEEITQILDITETPRSVEIDLSTGEFVDIESLMSGNRIWRISSANKAYDVSVCVADKVIKNETEFWHVFKKGGIGLSDYVVIGEDITFKEKSGISTAINVDFAGTIDGQGHTLKNLSSYSELLFSGAVSGTIKDLVILEAYSLRKNLFLCVTLQGKMENVFITYSKLMYEDMLLNNPPRDYVAGFAKNMYGSIKDCIVYFDFDYTQMSAEKAKAMFAVSFNSNSKLENSFAINEGSSTNINAYIEGESSISKTDNVYTDLSSFITAVENEEIVLNDFIKKLINDLVEEKNFAKYLQERLVAGLSGYQVANYDNTQDYNSFIKNGTVIDGNLVLDVINYNSTNSYVDMVKINTVLDASSGKESFVAIRVKSDVNKVRIYNSTMSAGTAYPPFLWTGTPSSWGIDYTPGEWVNVIFKLTDIGYTAGDTFDTLHFATWGTAGTLTIDYIEYFEYTAGKTKVEMYDYYNSTRLKEKLTDSLSGYQVANYDDADNYNLFIEKGTVSDGNLVLQLTNWTSTDSYVNMVKTNTVLDASSGKESFVVLRVKSDVNKVRIYGSTMSAGTAYPPFLWTGTPSSWGIDYTPGEWVTLIFKLTDIGYAVGDTFDTLHFAAWGTAGTLTIDYIEYVELDAGFTDKVSALNEYNNLVAN